MKKVLKFGICWDNVAKMAFLSAGWAKNKALLICCRPHFMSIPSFLLWKCFVLLTFSRFNS